jgi:peptidylprolyl isomerase
MHTWSYLCTLGAIKDANSVEAIIGNKKAGFISKAADKQKATDIIDNQIKPSLASLIVAIRKQDIASTLQQQEIAASSLAELRSLQLPKHKLPYVIPDEYSSLPRLEGTAIVELTVENPKGFRTDDNLVVPSIAFKLQVDGYHAPITAGNFIDLVSQKFYDGLTFNKIEELTVQTGLKKDQPNGYVDPKTNQIRTIPLELFYKQDSAPTYGYTSDEDQRATETMALPFQAYGAIGMARDNEQADSGSSQFFLLKWRQALIAPGRNTLDGFYSNFGYIVNNQDYLSQITPMSKIVTAKVVNGQENLVIPL